MTIKKLLAVLLLIFCSAVHLAILVLLCGFTLQYIAIMLQDPSPSEGVGAFLAMAALWTVYTATYIRASVRVQFRVRDLINDDDRIVTFEIFALAIPFIVIFSIYWGYIFFTKGGFFDSFRRAIIMLYGAFGGDALSLATAIMPAALILFMLVKLLSQNHVEKKDLEFKERAREYDNKRDAVETLISLAAPPNAKALKKRFKRSSGSKRQRRILRRGAVSLCLTIAGALVLISTLSYSLMYDSHARFDPVASFSRFQPVERSHMHKAALWDEAAPPILMADTVKVVYVDNSVFSGAESESEDDGCLLLKADGTVESVNFNDEYYQNFLYGVGGETRRFKDITTSYMTSQGRIEENSGRAPRELGFFGLLANGEVIAQCALDYEQSHKASGVVAIAEDCGLMRDGTIISLDDGDAVGALDLGGAAPEDIIEFVCIKEYHPYLFFVLLRDGSLIHNRESGDFWFGAAKFVGIAATEYAYGDTDIDYRFIGITDDGRIFFDQSHLALVDYSTNSRLPERFGADYSTSSMLLKSIGADDGVGWDDFYGDNGAEWNNGFGSSAIVNWEDAFGDTDINWDMEHPILCPLGEYDVYMYARKRADGFVACDVLTADLLDRMFIEGVADTAKLGDSRIALDRYGNAFCIPLYEGDRAFNYIGIDAIAGSDSVTAVSGLTSDGKLAYISQSSGYSERLGTRLIRTYPNGLSENIVNSIYGAGVISIFDQWGLTWNGKVVQLSGERNLTLPSYLKEKYAEERSPTADYATYDYREWQDIVCVAESSSHMAGAHAAAVGANDYGQCDVGGWTDIVWVWAGERFTLGLKSDNTFVLAGDGGGGLSGVTEWDGEKPEAFGSVILIPGDMSD